MRISDWSSDVCSSDLCDALMVARGDLGVEMPLQTVPGVQKRIVRAARRAGKPVVVATQMLDSMVKAPVPTRAEVSDVATADRKSVGSGKSVSVRLALSVRGVLKQKKQKQGYHK